jgi:hypothetical protein
LRPEANKLGVTHAVAYTTSAWQTYPGSTLPFNGGAISGHLTIEKGGRDNHLKLCGILKGRPPGIGGIHIHVGYDVDQANSAGDHYYDFKMCDDPLDNVKYNRTNGIIDAMVLGLSWATTATLAFEMIMHNPPFRQLDARVIASDYGHGITIDPVNANVPSGKAEMLRSVMTPQFIDFSITELGCCIDNEKHPTSEQLQMCLGPLLTKVIENPGTNLIFPGRCADMENKLLISVTPNIDLDSGSTITIRGLIRPGVVGRDAPKLRVDSSAGIHNHLGVVEWHEKTGTLVLVIFERDYLQPAKMAASVKSNFKLQLLMPETVVAVPAISPSIRASLPPSSPAALASCTETAEICSLPLRQAAKTVLQTQEAPASDVIRAISQQKFMPGACSSLTIAFSVNELLDHNSYFIVSGLTDMTRYVPLEISQK